MDWKAKAKKIKSDIPTLFFALKNKNTPIIAKIMAGITVAYALSPIDLIPDFIPILGYVDDVILLPVMLGLTIKFIPKNILEESRCKAEENSRKNKKISKRWYYAIPVILCWCILIAIIICAIV